MLHNLQGIGFDIPQTEKITNILKNFFRSSLIISRYNIDYFDELKVNGEDTMRFEINEYNIAFDFFLEDKNKIKVLEGFDKFGQKAYVNELEIKGIDFR
ncbi:hypothetical protein [Cohnella sp. WQ 127256]|uniref:hypothetical protein n=1 Tax=Cohnella sp. WQ 127256 TaxID=2938790 RepID=UPI002117641D|nr:hypothetical protein [Cohnella sp. WQ 127256]